MRVLITGGAGFVGSHVADRLLSRGDRVLVLDNYATGRRDNLEPRDGLEVAEVDIAEPEAVLERTRRFGPDAVVHAAASYKDPDDWRSDARTNVVGTANVVQATVAAGCDRLIYFQTALCYGVRPLAQPIGLDHPIRPGDSSYAISKTAGEQYIELSDLDWVSFRLANIYGPRNLSGPLPTFYRRLSAGQPCFVMDTRRDFVYIDDLMECVLRAVDGTGHGHYHLASGRDYSIRELFEAVVEAMGIELDEPVEVRPRQPDDAPTILLDPSRAEAEFDWATSTPLEDGVRRAVAYYERFGVEDSYTHLRGIGD